MYDVITEVVGGSKLHELKELLLTAVSKNAPAFPTIIPMSVDL